MPNKTHQYSNGIWDDVKICQHRRKAKESCLTDSKGLTLQIVFYLDCLEMLVEVVSVVLKAPIDSASEDSKDLSIRALRAGEQNNINKQFNR